MTNVNERKRKKREKYWTNESSMKRRNAHATNGFHLTWKRCINRNNEPHGKHFLEDLQIFFSAENKMCLFLFSVGTEFVMTPRLTLYRKWKLNLCLSYDFSVPCHLFHNRFRGTKSSIFYDGIFAVLFFANRKKTRATCSMKNELKCSKNVLRLIRSWFFAVHTFFLLKEILKLTNKSFEAYFEMRNYMHISSSYCNFEILSEIGYEILIELCNTGNDSKRIVATTLAVQILNLIF